MSRRLVQRVIPVGTVDTLGGDAVGDPAANTVVAVQHQPWDGISTPTVGQVPTWDGTQWTPETGATGAPGFGEICYVDLATGNDATALRGRIDLKFLTIQAAVDAAATGDLIEMGPGIFDESVTMDGADVDYLTFVGCGRSTYPGDVSSGTTWLSSSGVPLTLTDASAQVAFMSLIGDGVPCINVSATNDQALFLLGLDLQSSGPRCLDIDGLGALRCLEVAPTSAIRLIDVVQSDWSGSSYEPTIPYQLRIQDGSTNGTHLFHTGGYGAMVITGRPIVTIRDGVTVASVDGSAYTTSGAQFNCAGNVLGAVILDPRATLNLSNGVYNDQVSIESAGSPTYVNAIAATFLADINIGDDIAFDLTRAKYSSLLVTIGTGATTNYTDHTNDDQHGIRTAYLRDGINLLHPIVTALSPGFMSSAMLATLGSVASLTSTPPVPVTQSTAAVGVATTAARADHKHDIEVDTAVAITDSTSDAGSGSSLARSNHQHAHGARGGGTLHAAATGSVAGFMTAAQVNELTSTTATANAAVPNTRTVTAGAGMTGGGALSANITLDVVANGDGSIVVNAHDVQVGVLASDAQHGVRGGGTQHAAVNTTTNGFATPAMLAATQRTVVRTPVSYPYTIDPTDLVIRVDTTSARTIALPDPATYVGICWLKDIVGQANTNPITVTRFNTELIEGLGASAVLRANWGKWGVFSNGTNWNFL